MLRPSRRPVTTAEARSSRRAWETVVSAVLVAAARSQTQSLPGLEEGVEHPRPGRVAERLEDAGDARRLLDPRSVVGGQGDLLGVDARCGAAVEPGDAAHAPSSHLNG